jgi:hypothetical protein
MAVQTFEEKTESIHFWRTRDYFREVLSSYDNGNYRSATVMLWSVAVCDIVYKLQSLVDMYGDKEARQILDEMTAIQSNNNPRSPDWELRLVEEVYKRTELLEIGDYENLCYLQQQRHLAAHPVLTTERELHSPNKETIRALIRNTLDGVLIKPPLYTKRVFDEFLQDLEDSTPALNSDEKFKRYVESRYLLRVTRQTELSFFRSLWKLVFRVENEKCDKNRKINLKAITLLTRRNREKLKELISGERDYYGNVSNSNSLLSFLVFYLAKFPDIYELLNDDAKVTVQHCIENDDVGRTFGWFIRDSLEEHCQVLIDWIEGNDYPKFEQGQLDALLEISDTEDWEQMFCRIISSYYGASRSFDGADQRFAVAIEPYLHLFNENSLHYLLEKIEGNNQTWGRGRSYTDHPKIKERIDAVIGDAFEPAPYPRFWSQFEEG